MKSFNRREFLEWSAGATLGLTMLGRAEAQEQEKPRERPRPQPVEKVGPNEIINVACIGVNGRGMDQVGYFARSRETQVVAICDVDPNVIKRAMQTVETFQGKPPEFVQDLRRVMDNKGVHVVTIATPNHWHALATIWACQAGKDVYVEKPVCHNVYEGQKMVEAARKHKRTQTHRAVGHADSQFRSHPRGDGVSPLRQTGKGLHGEGAVLQTARLDW